MTTRKSGNKDGRETPVTMHPDEGPPIRFGSLREAVQFLSERQRLAGGLELEYETVAPMICTARRTGGKTFGCRWTGHRKRKPGRPRNSVILRLGSRPANEADRFNTVRVSGHFDKDGNAVEDERRTFYSVPETEPGLMEVL